MYDGVACYVQEPVYLPSVQIVATHIPERKELESGCESESSRRQSPVPTLRGNTFVGRLSTRLPGLVTLRRNSTRWKKQKHILHA